MCTFDIRLICISKFVVQTDFSAVIHCLRFGRIESSAEISSFIFIANRIVAQYSCILSMLSKKWNNNNVNTTVEATTLTMTMVTNGSVPMVPPFVLKLLSTTSVFERKTWNAKKTHHINTDEMRHIMTIENFCFDRFSSTFTFEAHRTKYSHVRFAFAFTCIFSDRKFYVLL